MIAKSQAFQNFKRTVFMAGAMIAVIVISTVAITSPRRQEPVKTTKERVTIIAFNLPKHCSISARSESGVTFNRIYVGKHFNEWREKLVVGREVVLTRAFYEDGSSKLIGVDEDLRR
jgi:hypothetical protein